MIFNQDNSDLIGAITSNTLVDDSAFTWESGTLDSNGNPQPNSARIRTTKLSLLGAASISITVSSGYRYECDWYNNSTYVGATGWKTASDNVTVPQNADSIRILLSKTDNSQIAISESSNITVNFAAKTLAESCIVELNRITRLESIGIHQLVIHSGTAASERGRASILIYGKLFIIHGVFVVETALSQGAIIYDLPNYNYDAVSMSNNIVVAGDGSSYTTVGIDNTNKTLKVTYTNGMPTGLYELLLFGWIN